MEEPILHELISVMAGPDAATFIAKVDVTDMLGDRFTCDYITRVDDLHGLAPIIWQSIEEWVADGKAILPYVAPAPVIPDRVTANQFGKQLAAMGLLAQVETWVAKQDVATQWSFNRSATFVREDPMMQAGFVALGFTSEQIDAFFVAAAALT